MDTTSSSTLIYERFRAYSASRAAQAVAFLWGLAEATVFFIIPDVYLGLIPLFNWRKGLLATVLALAGAMVGGTLMYFLAANNPAGMHQLLLSIPLIHQYMLDLVQSELQTGGLWMIVSGPKQGIPYKIYAVQSGIQGLPLLEFLLVTIPARLGRFLIVALITSLLGRIFQKFIREHTRLVVGIYAAFWICVYVSYYLRFR
jgi:membrane protein YqaA with SNARE-associated domain